MVQKVHNDPLKTKTGKTRLGPLSLQQLDDMLPKARSKDRSKIQNRINYLINKKGFTRKESSQVESVSE
jgi:GTP cyclohydrolase FolE2